MQEVEVAVLLPLPEVLMVMEELVAEAMEENNQVVRMRQSIQVVVVVELEVTQVHILEATAAAPPPPPPA